eukprot:scaffold196176_cov19-Tisochrysis_lutea.AAC.1
MSSMWCGSMWALQSWSALWEWPCGMWMFPIRAAPKCTCHFSHRRPVMLLRMVVNAAVFLFYVSCFTVFLAAFNCNWFMEGQGEIQTAEGTTEIVDLRFRMNRFPEVRECC